MSNTSPKVSLPMSLSPIVLIGAGGHASVVADIILKSGLYQIIGYTAPVKRECTGQWSFTYLGDDSILPSLLKQGVTIAALGVGGTGDNRPRYKLYEQIRNLGFSFPPLIHPSATVAEGTTVGSGSIIAPGAIINPGARIGNNVIINSGAIVEHDCVVEDHVHIAPGAVICGGARVGSLAHVGAGAVVIQGITIGEGAVIGAGTVVIHKVEPWTVVVGNPGRVIRAIKEES